jgi:hypothetical protein
MTQFEHLVYLQFSRATVIYTTTFEVVIDGPLWPREMEAALKIIQLYKEQHKESNLRSSNKS